MICARPHFSKGRKVMEYRKYDRHYVVRLDKDEEIVTSLEKLCEKEKISLGFVSGIGAVNQVIAGLFRTGEKRFLGHTWEGDMEIVSLTGLITTMDDSPYLHLHIAVADEEGNVRGGHLKKAVIGATGELTISLEEGKIDRKFSREIGLNLLEF